MPHGQRTTHVAQVNKPLPDSLTFLRKPIWGRAAIGALVFLLVWWLITALRNDTPGPRTLRIANGPDPASLDPAGTSSLAEGRVLSALFEGLLGTDPKTLEPVPGLAAALPTVSSDGLTYTFPIREGLRWSDGQPLDASSLRWSFLRFLDPKTAARWTDPLMGVRGAAAYNAEGGDELRESVGIRAPDAQTLVFELEHPLPVFPNLLTLFPLFPVPRHVIEKHGSMWTRPRNFVSNGPYKLVHWKLRDRIRVRKNPHYRNPGQVKIPVIDYLCVESPSTMLNLFVAGAADIITEVPTSAVQEVKALYGPPHGAGFEPGMRLGTYYYVVNTGHPPLNSRSVRRAMSLGIQRKTIAEGVMRAGELPARSFVPPGTRCSGPIYEPPLQEELNEADARALLRKGLLEIGADPENPPIIELMYSTSEASDQPIAELVQERWTRLGLRVRLVNLDSGSVRAAVRRGNFQIARSSWIGDYDEPSTFLNLYTSDGARNQTGFASARYDEIIKELAPRTRDGAKRSVLYKEAESLLVQDAVIMPLYHYVSRSLKHGGVDGWWTNVLDWHPPQFLAFKDERR